MARKKQCFTVGRDRAGRFQRGKRGKRTKICVCRVPAGSKRKVRSASDARRKTKKAGGTFTRC